MVAIKTHSKPKNFLGYFWRKARLATYKRPGDLQTGRDRSRSHVHLSKYFVRTDDSCIQWKSGMVIALFEIERCTAHGSNERPTGRRLTGQFLSEYTNFKFHFGL